MSNAALVEQHGHCELAAVYEGTKVYPAVKKGNFFCQYVLLNIILCLYIVTYISSCVSA